MQDRPGPFTLREGAAALGISLNTLRRRIAAGEIKAEKVDRPQGFVWQVYLDSAVEPFQDRVNGTVHQDGAGTVQAERSPTPALAQAEAMAAYTRSLLEPLVAHVGELETTIRDQAETIGRQKAELERAASTVVALNRELERLQPAPAPPEAPGSSDGLVSPTEPSTFPEPFRSRLAHERTLRELVTRWWRAGVTALVLVAVLVWALLLR